ncbi:MAG: CDP-alcohol phosphatidyltransferase family protein [Bacteroidales bacterium]|nr:CDP-alcohol phosphatidyltransferase family protein [Bacteroidales bacterium]
MKKQIPNIITLGNLLCGVLASYFAIRKDIHFAAILICAGIVLDFFDGMAARLLKVPSELGKQLDSLADLVTSGVAPAFIVFSITYEASNTDCSGYHLLCFLFLLIPIFAAYRLAKFNLDTEQSHTFKGLPVPANALIWVGLALALPDLNSTICLDIETYYKSSCYPIIHEIWQQWYLYAILAVSIITNILMVSRLPMFSLKFNFKDLAWRKNSVQYIFLIGCAIIAILMLFANTSLSIYDGNELWLALPLSILWYILLSILTVNKTKCQETHDK